jgi:hypothetical protein
VVCIRHGSLLPESVLVRKAVVSHDKRSQAVREGVDARPRLCMGAFVWPDDVEARVDARYGEAVQRGVAEGEGGEVVGVRELASCRG